ncbi:hypothetical protein C0J52_04135 [Blattella germanica]|nr:hypothetical protein C0J52_04135 [Blattella germanica]
MVKRIENFHTIHSFYTFLPPLSQHPHPTCLTHTFTFTYIYSLSLSDNHPFMSPVLALERKKFCT